MTQEAQGGRPAAIVRREEKRILREHPVLRVHGLRQIHAEITCQCLAIAGGHELEKSLLVALFVAVIGGLEWIVPTVRLGAGPMDGCQLHDLIPDTLNGFELEGQH